ncbi:hypothetical protein jhhlp_000831 [Lomentospora prolificans]|uniref:Uncharacterized protein n=1 Tax=Lomentospora prolificans TaxID=41688 RepID=A0A2N3NJL4_9PEZI|nr:hypothetical protein jhhlp_000831 [Lomentospora prolificans]
MMERLIRTRPIGSVMRREPGRIPSLIRTVQRTLGFPTTDDAAIMGKMVSDLRKVSEKTLGKSLRGQKVSVTAPWQPLWKEDDKRDCDVNDALWAAGLKPWDTHSTSPLYLSEVRTSLAASGRLLCEPYGCHGFDRDPRDVPEYVYYISFTNRSLYTTFIQGGCFYKAPVETVGIIDERLGLDHLGDSSPDKYWNDVSDRLLARGAYFNKWIKSRSFYAIKPIVLVTGEAAEDPKFLSIVEKIAAELPSFLLDGEAATQSTADDSGQGAELIVLDDPATAPARAAALWSRMKMEEASYCKTEQCCDRYGKQESKETKSYDDDDRKEL